MIERDEERMERALSRMVWLLFLCALAFLGALLMFGCAHIDVEKPDGTRIKARFFGIDPKVDELRTDSLYLKQAGWKSDPGVRLAEMAFEAGKAVGAAAMAADLEEGPLGQPMRPPTVHMPMLSEGPIIPPIKEDR